MSPSSAKQGGTDSDRARFETSATPELTPRSTARQVPLLWAFLSYLALAVLLTYPLVRQPGTALPNDLGDPLLNTWILWWNTQVLPLTERWWHAPFFYPAADTLAFSEHLLGLLPISAPVQWITGNPVLAYNTAFLLSFPLSGVAAYLLSLELTGRRDAAWVGGLVYGFAPYRADQLAHLQVLSSYWLPIILLALHVYLRDRRTRWLILFGAAYLLQGLCNGYFLLFAPVLVGLWLVWFVPIVQEWRVWARVATAGGLAAAVVLPILLRYQAVHDGLGFSRGLEETASFSADLTSLLSASSQLGVWGFLDTFSRPEGQLFPGLTVVCLLAGGAIRSRWRPDGWQPPWLRGARAALAAIAGAFAAVVLSRLLFGPWDTELLGVHVSVHGFDKPFSFAMLFATAFAVTSPIVVSARARRSPFGFYLLALAAMWILTWGPFPTFLDQPIIHSGPYAWLRAFPGFDSLRVPARFWMLALVCLSAAGSLALARMTSVPLRMRHAIVGLVACGVFADGWISAMRTVPVPGRSAILEGSGAGPVLEWPLGRHTDDLESVYRSIYHGRPVINGYSGYPAKHYAALRYGLADPRENLLSLLAPLGVTDVLIDRKEVDGPFVQHLARETGARPIAATADEVLYRLSGGVPAEAHPTTGVALAIAGLTASVNQDDVGFAVDGDQMSRWHTGTQRSGHELTLDLGTARALRAVVLELGPFVADFPRLLTVELSLDRQEWTEVWRGPTASKALRASLDDPLRVPLSFLADGRHARFVRLRQLAADRMAPWSIAEISVTGTESSSVQSD